MKKQKTNVLPVSKNLQRLFVYSVAAAVIVVFTRQFLLAMMQVSTNPNLSSFYTTFIALSLLPAVMFLIAYLLTTRNISQGQRVFESLLVAVSAYAANITLNTVVTSTFWSLKVSGGVMFGTFGLPTITVALIILVVSVYLVSLRKAGRW